MGKGERGDIKSFMSYSIPLIIGGCVDRADSIYWLYQTQTIKDNEMSNNELTNDELNETVENYREQRLDIHKQYKQAVTQHGNKSNEARTLWIAFCELHTEAQPYIKLQQLRRNC